MMTAVQMLTTQNTYQQPPGYIVFKITYALYTFICGDCCKNDAAYKHYSEKTFCLS